MIETLQSSAKRFCDLRFVWEVIPPDDVDLPEEMWDQRIRRRERENRKYLDGLSELLKNAPISEFFKKQIIEEAYLESLGGFTKPEAVEEANQDYFGINLEAREFGFFDPQKALKIEKRYFKWIKPMLIFRERNGLEIPVKWQDWEAYLESLS